MRSRRFVLLAYGLTLVSCSSELLNVPIEPQAHADARAPFTITPNPTPIIYGKQTLQFTASTNVTWSLSWGLGSISATGLYTAPDQAEWNSVDVIATAKSNPRQIVRTGLSIGPSPRDTVAPPDTATPPDTVTPPPPPPPTGGVARPAGNTGTGFFVVGRKIYDANGIEFRPRGVNNNHVWAAGGAAAIPAIAASKSNVVRVVLSSWTADPDGVSSPAYRKAELQKYINVGIVPIPVFYQGRRASQPTTGSNNPATLSAVVDDLIGTDAAWAKSLERYVMINIANEWGDEKSTAWRDNYITAVQRLRRAGINALLVIDAGGSGEDSGDLRSYAAAIEAADPQHNVVFSIHLYSAFWRNPTDPQVGSWGGGEPYNTKTELAALGALSVPVIVGEFSSDPYNVSDFNAHLDPSIVISSAEAAGLGWVGWMWVNNDNPLVNVVNNPTRYSSSSDLTAFGKILIEGPQGTKALARKATIF